MSAEGPWQGNWVARMYARVRERGYDSLTAFATARPTASLVELADDLGEDGYSAAQLFSGLVEEAERSHQVARLVRGQFVRELYEHLPDGWPAVMNRETRFTIAKTIALWLSFTPVTHEARARQVGDALLASPPPPGWRPLGPDDELLRTLLPDEEA
ncbi:NUDIX hydrolase [Pyxidicoccus sp. 3LG]